MERFLQACQADDRVLAACLIGSYAKGRADPYSDIVLMVITTDSAYDEFYRQRKAFLRSLGDLVFLEDWGIPDLAFHIFADGTEGELYFGSESRLHQLYDAPFRVLLDKKDILAGVTYVSPVKAPSCRVNSSPGVIRWTPLLVPVPALVRGCGRVPGDSGTGDFLLQFFFSSVAVTVLLFLPISAASAPDTIAPPTPIRTTRARRSPVNVFLRIHSVA